ncbi:hypothetical protein AVEN_20640-1 [Araneus ventricosus]|uniref:Uncharacterized protein n=1 Tax=Araneus ventricosus TaxID=182803 RepID=A0A4Y2RC68_ARAVE|nr:hypothetical protein AVEN_20640-1 [Araneus ventricosus]
MVESLGYLERMKPVASKSDALLKDFDFIGLGGTADYLDLYTNDDVGDVSRKFQQDECRDSKQISLHLNENEAYFSIMSTSNENVAFNVSSNQRLSMLQYGNPLNGLSSHCLVYVQPKAYVVKKEENLYCLATSDISEPVYESESDVRGSSCTKAFIRDYIETFTSTFIEQNALQSFNYFNSDPSEEYGEENDDSNRNALFYVNACAPE